MSNERRKKVCYDEDKLFAELDDALDGQLGQILTFPTSFQVDNKKNETPIRFHSIDFDEKENDVTVVAEWKRYKGDEHTEYLSQLVTTHESYLITLIEFVLDVAKAMDATKARKITECVGAVYVSTASTLPIGSIVQIMNGEDINDQFKYACVKGHEPMQREHDLVFNLWKYHNTVISILDTRMKTMAQPTRPPRIHDTRVSQADLDEIALVDGDGEPVTPANAPFEIRYLLFQLDLSERKIESLEAKLSLAANNAAQNCAKQIQIAVERAQGLLQPRFEGQKKSVSIACNADTFLTHFKKKLEDAGVTVRRRGYVYEGAVARDLFQVVFGDGATLEERTEPDQATMSNGASVIADNLSVVWSNYSLKLKLVFVIEKHVIEYRAR